MFLLGLLGTGHCLGMCGPLVLAIGAHKGSFATNLAYNLGRVFTYVALGAILGAVGTLVLSDPDANGHALAELKRVQAGFSLFAALILLGFGLVRLSVIPEPRWMSISSPTRIPGFGKLASSVSRHRRILGIFVFGVLMGLLPCGLSYAAFAGAMVAGSAVKSATLVLAFGLGTIPGLLLVGTGASKLGMKLKRLSDRLSGVLMLAMACWIGAKAFMKLGGGCC